MPNPDNYGLPHIRALWDFEPTGENLVHEKAESQFEGMRRVLKDFGRDTVYSECFPIRHALQEPGEGFESDRFAESFVCRDGSVIEDAF